MEQISTNRISPARRILFLSGLGVAIGWAVLCLLKYGSVISCYDGVSHLYIPKTVIENGSYSGLYNLGTVWLFGFHLLVLPFTAIKYLYTTGLAGTIVNTLAFSLSAILIYSILPNKFGLLASCLFIFNPYSLIYATAPMSEMTAIFFILLSLYLLKRWMETRRLKLWILLSLSLSLGSLVRYEVWVVTVGAILFSLIYGIRKRLYGLIIYIPLPLAGILVWLLYNLLFFHDPFIFLTHPCARIPLNTPYAGSWTGALHHSLLMTYWIGGGLLIPGVIGLIVLIIRRDPLALLVILLLLPSLIHIPLGVTRHSLGYSRFFLYTLPALSLAGFGWVSHIKRFQRWLALLILVSPLLTLPSFIKLVKTGGNSFVDYRACQDIYYPTMAEALSLNREIMERVGEGKTLFAFRQFYQLLSLSTGSPPSQFYDAFDTREGDYRIIEKPWLYAKVVIVDSLREVDRYWMEFTQGKYFNYLFFKDPDWRRKFLSFYKEGFRVKNSIVFFKR